METDREQQETNSHDTCNVTIYTHTQIHTHLWHSGPKHVACRFWLFFIESYSTQHLLQNTFYSIKISSV